MTSRILAALLLLSCTAASAQTVRTFQHDGLSRSYILYVPSGFEGVPDLPLVFVLHGFTQTAEGIMNYSEFNAIADTAGFIVVYPSGVQAAWNTNTGFPGGSSADDVGFIKALIDTLAAEFGIDTGRVYTCGMSAGGFMSHRLACEAGDRFAAIASVTGTMSSAAFQSCNPVRPMPVMQIHGTSDAIVPYNGGFANVSVVNTIGLWTDHNQCPETPSITALPDLVQEGSTVDRIEYAPCSEDSRVVLLRVNNGGHTWPGAQVVSGIGNTNQDISASIEIWRFFREHALLSTSITDTTPMHRVRVFPNPAGTWLLLEVPAIFDGSLVHLYDSNGRVRLEQIVQEGLHRLDLYTLERGVYFLYFPGTMAQPIQVQKH